jgi:hypothetical protein
MWEVFLPPKDFQETSEKISCFTLRSTCLPILTLKSKYTPRVCSRFFNYLERPKIYEKVNWKEKCPSPYNSCSNILHLGYYTVHVRRKSRRTSYPWLLPFVTKIRKVRQSDWIKIHSVDFELLHADRTTCRNRAEACNMSRTEDPSSKLRYDYMRSYNYGSSYERYTLMGSNAVTVGEFPTFQRSVLSPHSGLRCNPRNKPAVIAECSCWFLVSLTLRPENGSNISLRNVGLP